MKYTFGDEVLLGITDSTGNTVLKPCSVVGITLIENENQSLRFSHAVGTVLYTVEFGDGSDALVPEETLLPIDWRN